MAAHCAAAGARPAPRALLLCTAGTAADGLKRQRCSYKASATLAEGSPFLQFLLQQVAASDDGQQQHGGGALITLRDPGTRTGDGVEVSRGLQTTEASLISPLRVLGTSADGQGGWAEAAECPRAMRPRSSVCARARCAAHTVAALLRPGCGGTSPPTTNQPMPTQPPPKKHSGRARCLPSVRPSRSRSTRPRRQRRQPAAAAAVGSPRRPVWPRHTTATAAPRCVCVCVLTLIF